MSPSEEPFNEKKYTDLMDGLECKELMLSYVLNSSVEGRMDSHFFEKKYERIIAGVDQHNPICLKDVVSKPIQTGHTPSMKEDRFYNGNIAFIKTDNLRNGFITTNFDDYLTEEGNQTIARTFLQEKDIITTIIGASKDVIARSAIINKELLPCNINQNIVQIRIDEEHLAPEYVYVYLNTNYGKNYLYYFSKQTEQFNLNCEDVGLVKIPRFSDDFMKTIQRISKSHSEFSKMARDALLQAEDILKNEIGLDIYSIPRVGITRKTLSESLGESGRIDAEYYQPIFEVYENHITKYFKGYTTPRKVFTQVKTKCCRELPVYSYVEIGDIDTENGTANSNLLNSDELPDNAKIMTQKGDLLVSTVRPNRGAVAILQEDSLLVSGAFTVLRETGQYPVHTLQVLLRTSLYKEWLLKFNVGTSYPVIKDDDVLDIPIPLMDDTVNQRIKCNVIKSQEMLNKSKYYLETAKKALEIAIEENEIEALNWLNKQNIS